MTFEERDKGTLEPGKLADLVLLDEATSAADPENQVEIDRAIENLCRGKTVIIVAHRLGIVQGCDRVAVVEKGGVSAAGRFEEMLQSSPYFSKAWADYNAARNIQYSLKGARRHEIQCFSDERQAEMVHCRGGAGGSADRDQFPGAVPGTGANL